MESGGDGLNLIQRVGRGEVDAVVELYKKYVDLVYRSVYNQLDRNHQATEDVVQEIFTSVIEAACNYEGRSNERTWLYAITNRKVADYYRKKKAKDKHIAVNFGHDESFTEGLADPEDMETNSIAKCYVSDILEKLPLQYRQVLSLKYLDDMSLSEISVVMGKSVKSVEGLLTRAKAQFRKYLDGAETFKKKQ